MSSPIEGRETDPQVPRRGPTRRRLPRQPEPREVDFGYQPPAVSVEWARKLEAVGYSTDAMDLINALRSRFMETNLAKRYLADKDQRTAASAILISSGVRGRGLNVAMDYLKASARDSVRSR